MVPLDARIVPATEADWNTEYLDAIVSVGVVDGLDGAIRHIETHGSHHTDCIITENDAAAQRFLAEVDSAIVIHNASTQFADGGEFRLRRRDRHRDGADARARPHRARTIDHVQISHSRHGADSSVTAFGPVRLPPHAPGQKIGLFGGSFNPAHEGHRAASLLALKRLRLDRVWWLVSPGNPLKDTRQLVPHDLRTLAAQRLARHPRITVTNLEAHIGTRYTYDTIAYLKRRMPACHFVWLMGADNFIHFDRWYRWREIADLVPLAIIDRPGSTLKAAHARAAKALEGYRLEESDALLLPFGQPAGLRVSARAKVAFVIDGIKGERRPVESCSPETPWPTVQAKCVIRTWISVRPAAATMQAQMKRVSDIAARRPSDFLSRPKLDG